MAFRIRSIGRRGIRAGQPRGARRRLALPEMAIGFCLAVLFGYAAIQEGLVPVSLVDGLAPAVSDSRGEAISARFSRCGGSGGTCVIDGDTIRVDGVSVRIADIDTPEVRGYQCAEEQALGQRATERMIELVNAGPFTMETWDHRDTDVYGRKLRVLKRDGQSLGMILVTEGLAREWGGRRESWCAG